MHRKNLPSLRYGGFSGELGRWALKSNHARTCRFIHKHVVRYLEKQMTFEDSVQTEKAIHATLVFERSIPAPVEQVFAALAEAKKRTEWGAPSETAMLIYDHEDFREGGEDRFRCGSKSNPNIHGTTHYLQIVENARIVSSEVIVMDGKQLCASLTTLELTKAGSSTKLKSTSQIASFVGQDMINGHEQGNNGSLNSLVSYFSKGR